MKRIPLMLVMALLSLTAMAQTFVPFSRPVHPRVVAKAPAKAAEVRDENGIITTPASGVEKVFTRDGGVLSSTGYATNEGVQSGECKFVFCEDGTVYWNHPLSEALEAANMELTDSWVKGKLEGETLTFAPGQPISYSVRPPYSTYNLYMCDYDESAGYPDALPVKDENIVFKLSRGGKIMTLQNSSTRHMLGAFKASNDYTIGTHWDYATVFVLDDANEHDPAVTLPAGVTAKDYVIGNHDTALDLNAAFRCKLAFQGDDVYMGGFSYYGKGKWVKGKKQNDGSLVFPKEQFLSNAVLESSKYAYNLYFYGIPQGSNNVTDLCDVVFTYNATTNQYVAAQDIIIGIEKLSTKLDVAERVTRNVIYDYPHLNDTPIFTIPGGYRVITYDCHGQVFNGNDGGWWYAGQEGLQIKIAYAPDGKSVLMNQPCAWVLPDSWIKGTIEADGKLHVPTMQMVQDDEDMGRMWTGVFSRYDDPSGAGYRYDPAPEFTEVTFTIDEDGFLTLDPFSADQVDGKLPAKYIYGDYAGSDEFLCRNFGDAYTIYTPVEGSEFISGDEEENPGDNPDVKDDFDVNTPVAGEVRNELGIITTPGNGTAKTYNRSGKNYAVVDGDIANGDQSGVIHLVETADGIVYMERPLSTYSKAYAATAWIKGKRDDDAKTISFPAGQAINYDMSYDTELIVMMGQYDSTNGGTFVADGSKKNIVFEISADGKTLSLAGSNNATPLGLFYADDNEWVGYGDYNTVLTFNTEGIAEEVVEPSWKAQKLNYTLTAQDIETGGVGYNAVLAFEGNDVYLANFSYWLDYAFDGTGKYTWIKGQKREDGSLYFPREQYLYTYQNNDLFFYGCKEGLPGTYSPTDLVFTYDAKNDVYTAQQDIFISWGRISTAMNRAEQLTNVRLVRNNGSTTPYVITERPEGNSFLFARSGIAASRDYMAQSVYFEKQDGGEIEMVFSRDGRFVYMHQPISKATNIDSWVSGTVDQDGNLHIPMGQWIDYSEEYGYGFQTAACVLVTDNGMRDYFIVPNITEISFTFDPYTISFKMDRIEGLDYDNTPDDAPRLLYGVYSTDDYTWTGFGDFDSVYTPLFDTTNFDGFATGIKSVNAPAHDGESYYDFAGRKARANDRGMIIKNGKKILVK